MGRHRSLSRILWNSSSRGVGSWSSSETFAAFAVEESVQRQAEAYREYERWWKRHGKKLEGSANWFAFQDEEDCLSSFTRQPSFAGTGRVSGDTGLGSLIAGRVGRESIQSS